MTLYDLLIEYRSNPIGLDTPPRFSWKIKSERQNVKQTAWQIQIRSAGRMAWDSGRVESNQSILIPYGGEALLPATQYQALVSVWNDLGELAQETCHFETGLMSESNWQAEWITHTLPENETACPVYVRCFDVHKPLRSARLYATACGVYEACINGQKVGNAYFAPGWTSYHKRLQYQTYDITALLRKKKRDRHHSRQRLV